MLRVSGKRQERFRSGTKHKPVDGSSVLKGERSELVRKREDDVEILHVEKLLLSGLKPGGTGGTLTLRAMPVTAGVVQADDVTTLLALTRPASQNGCSALNEVRQDTTLLLGWAVVLNKGCTVLTNDIGHFGPIVHFVRVVALLKLPLSCRVRLRTSGTPRDDPAAAAPPSDCEPGPDPGLAPTAT